MSDYNGWTNYETWNIPLWIDNEYSIYQDRMVRLKPGSRWTARGVEAFARYRFPDGTPDMDGAADYAKVNWQEIADNWNEE